MFYTIYKTTCVLNGKYYIGKHKTTVVNDNYIGSGKILKAAIKKYGRENFIKEILHVFDNEKKMNVVEKILVVPDKEINYNITRGGNGGLQYTDDEDGRNRRSENLKAWYAAGTAKFLEKLSANSEFADSFAEKARRNAKKATEASKKLYPNGTFKGRRHRVDTIEKMKVSHLGKHDGPLNSQYGSFWITDGSINRKCKIGDSIPTDWIKGRIIK